MGKKQKKTVDKGKEDDMRSLADIKKIYGERFLEELLDPKNMVEMDRPDGFARYTGPCGDTMEIFLRIKDDVISDAAYRTDGCGSTIVCGSIVTEMAKGRSLAKAFAIDQEAVLKKLGGLPEEEKHCALLAVTTLKKALNDFNIKKREPWKKFYPI